MPLRTAVLAPFLALLVTACSDGTAEHAAVSQARSAAPAEAPATRPATATTPRLHVQPPAPAPPPFAARALGVLANGAAALPAPPEPAEDGEPDIEEEKPTEEPRELGGYLLSPEFRWFLRYPRVDPAVQFSCGSTFRRDESTLLALLDRADDEDAVVALAALLHVRAPRGVEAQWRALCRLQLLHGDDPLWSETLAALRRPFTPQAIDAALAATPPEGRYDEARAIEWSARAAGVTRHRGALPRLVELSRGEHLDTSLAAERSLEDFPGPEGDAALAACLVGWRYDAYVRAGRALAERNGDLVRATLSTADVPADAQREVGLLLAGLRDPAAVPHLCASVGKAAIVDGKMFDAIEQLATAEQLALVDALPATVRDTQRERAERVVAAVRARLGL